MNTETVIRVTSDCPIVDPQIIDATARLYFNAAADFASNNMPRTWPHGLDCEVFSARQLAKADEQTTDLYEREHVTPWMRTGENFSNANLAFPGDNLGHHRWTLDTPDDMAFFDALYKYMPTGRSAFDYRVALSIVTEHPEISTLNVPSSTAP